MNTDLPRGKITDYGDLIHEERWLLKSSHAAGIRWHVGVARDASEEPGKVAGPPYAETPERVDLIMDLMADQEVDLTVEWTDQRGNPVETPDGATAVYTVDNPTVIQLTDNGDGSAVAMALGPLGTANVHGEFTGDGTTVTGDLQIVVVTGLAERANIVAGTPRDASA